MMLKQTFAPCLENGAREKPVNDQPTAPVTRTCRWRNAPSGAPTENSTEDDKTSEKDNYEQLTALFSTTIPVLLFVGCALSHYLAR
jgi:hypothetical protein